MDYINNVTVFSLEMATVRDPIFSPFPDVYFPNGESPKNVSEVTFPVFRSRTLMVVTSPRWLIVTVFSLEMATVRDPIFSPLLFM